MEKIPKKPIDLNNASHELFKSFSAETFIEHIHSIHDIVSKNISLANEAYKKYADLHKRFKTFNVNDLVMVKLHPQRLPKTFSKLNLKSYGPFRILTKINDNSYIVDIPSEWNISNSFNISDLVSYQKNSEVPNEMFASPQALESVDSLNSNNSFPKQKSKDGLVDEILQY